MKLQFTLICLFLLLTLSSATRQTKPKPKFRQPTYFQRLYKRRTTQHVVLAKASASFPGLVDRFTQFEVKLEFKKCQPIHFALAVQHPACKQKLIVGKRYVILLQDLFKPTPVCPVCSNPTNFT